VFLVNCPEGAMSSGRGPGRRVGLIVSLHPFCSPVLGSCKGYTTGCKSQGGFALVARLLLACSLA
jgi:hypothetical protein